MNVQFFCQPWPSLDATCCRPRFFSDLYFQNPFSRLSTIVIRVRLNFVATYWTISPSILIGFSKQYRYKVKKWKCNLLLPQNFCSDLYFKNPFSTRVSTIAIWVPTQFCVSILDHISFNSDQIFKNNKDLRSRKKDATCCSLRCMFGSLFQKSIF